MQSELPKPTTLPSDYEFNLVEFLDENWFFLAGFALILAFVIYYSIYKRKLRNKKESL